MAESDPPDKAGNVPHHPVMGPEEWYDSFREWTNDSFEIQGEVHFSNNGPSKVSHWGIVDFGPILGRVYRDDVEPNAYRHEWFCRDKYRSYYLANSDENTLKAYKGALEVEECELLDDLKWHRPDGTLVYFIDPEFYESRIRPFIPRGHPEHRAVQETEQQKALSDPNSLDPLAESKNLNTMASETHVERKDAARLSQEEFLECSQSAESIS